METRTCSKCNTPKPIEDFRLRNRFTRRRQSYCNDCEKKMGADWYEGNKDYQKANAGKHREKYRQRAREYVKGGYKVAKELQEIRKASFLKKSDLLQLQALFAGSMRYGA